MKPIVADTDDRRWQAVCERDTRADGQFVFAVLTTGICCRPSCRSRRARRENVRFFADVAAAVAAGFRPCKRCQPDKDYPQQQRVDKVAQACRLLEQDAPLTLEALAGQLAMSPFHFHRLFKSVTGMTPKAWQQAWRAQRLREALEQGIPVTRAALAAGFPDSSSYYRQADAALGMTASRFRRGGAATVVTWTTGDCALGRCLVAQSERGVCAVLPGDNDAALLDDLRRRFPNAELREGDPDFCQRWPRFSPTSTTAGGRYRCRWICRAPRFSCRSGRRCGRSRWARPAATARWQSILTSRGRLEPWPAPARRIRWR